MNRFVRRNRNVILLWGVLIVIGLLIANAWHHELITPEILKKNKDAIQAASSVLTATVVVVGAFLTYYRFFKGRTFSLRGQIEIKVNVHDLLDAENLHVVKVLFKNVGTTAIFNPKLKLIVHILGDNEERRVIDQWFDPGKELVDVPRMYFVDPEESASFLTHVTVSKMSPSVIYTAIISSEEKVIWQDAQSVSNILTSIEKDA